MIKLYYIRTTRSVRPRWLLEEMGLPYELIHCERGDTEQLEYRKLHPHGKVPVLVDGETVLFESAAICAYLADKYPDKGLAPAPGTAARGYYYQWLCYGMTTLEPPVEKFLFSVMPHLPEKLIPHSNISSEQASQWFDRVSEPIGTVLMNQDFLVDNQFTAADVIVGGVLLWAQELGMIGKDDSLTNYMNRIRLRPAFCRATDDWFLPRFPESPELKAHSKYHPV